MWTWKHLHYRQREENWLYQRWLVLFTLQHYVRSNGLLLPFLSLSGRTVKLKDILNKTGVIASCSGETMRTKWRFCKLTNLTVFAALLKVIPTGRKDAMLPELLLKNCRINFSHWNRTRHNHISITCVFFVLLFHICTKLTDWKKKLYKFSIHP